MAKVANKKPRGSRGTVGKRPYSGPELLLDLVDHATHVLASQGGLEQAQARELSIQLAERIAHAWAGSKLWFPRPRPSTSSVSWFRLEARDLEVYRLYNGRNMDEIRERFNLRPSAVHAIVARVRLERRAQLARLGPTTPGLVPIVTRAIPGDLFAESPSSAAKAPTPPAPVAAPT